MVLNSQSLRAEANFRARLEELGATLIEQTWLGSDKPHEVICSAGHKCNPSPSNIKQGHGICLVCANRDPSTAEANFRARLEELGATLLEQTWLGSDKPHEVICSAGHKCNPRPSNVRQGHGICLVCANRDPSTAETNFRARLAEMGATLLEPVWLGAQIPHNAICVSGHHCKPRPNDVKKGRGICRVCARNDPDTAEANFRARLAEMGATLLEPVWLGSDKPHKVNCSAGHECSPRPSSIERGQGICLNCIGKLWDVFYIVSSPDRSRVKFGITSGDPRPRLSDHKRDGYTDLLRLHSGMRAFPANKLESLVIKRLMRQGIMPIQGREYYHGSALAEIMSIVRDYLGDD